MDTNGLVSDHPRSDASHRLRDLIQHRATVVDAYDSIDREQRAATEAAEQASRELAALERAALGGQDVAPANRKTAEQLVAKTRAAKQQAWAERRDGARHALRDADQAIALHVQQSYDVLASELDDDARNAADDVDRALQRLADAYAEREAVAARVTVLANTAGLKVEPGTVARSRCEAVVREAMRVLEAGGEHPPTPVPLPTPDQLEEAIA